MNWNDYKDKPLVFFEGNTVEDIVRKSGYRCKEEDAQPLFDKTKRADNYFFELLEKGVYKEAIDFLSAAMNARVRIWWGYICVQETYKELRKKAFSVPDAKKITEEVASDPAHKALLDLTPEDLMPQPVIKNGINLSDPASWPTPKLDQNGTLILFPEPIQSSPGRQKLGIELFFEKRAKTLKALSPEQKEKFLRWEEQQRLKAEKELGMTPEEFTQKIFDAQQQLKGTPPSSPFDALDAKFDASERAINGKMGELQKHIEAMRAQLPKKKSRKKAGSPVSMNALEAAKDWILIPSDENARKAFEIGKQCKNDEKPAGLIAQSAFWSGTNIAPPGKNPVPPPPQLPARSVAVALVVAANLPGGERKPEERMEDYLKKGIEVAQGINTWENDIIPETDKHPWEGKPGFGREYQ